MNTLKKSACALGAFLLGHTSLSAAHEPLPAMEYEKGPYEATWKSLSQAELPEWAIDAKFGVYAHWGLYSVGIGPAWLERHMYRDRKDKTIAKFEKLVGGKMSEGKGYKDLVPFFTADKYDAAEWADLMVQSGAKFAGFSIGHHDGFGLWDSDVYDWNVGKMGPKRDLYGEFVTELRQRDIKVFCTSHIFRHYSWSVPNDKSPKEKKTLELGQKEGWDIFNPKYNHIYQNKYNGADFTKYRKDWQLKITEVIDKYSPDIMWFDGDILGGMDFKEPFAHYYNKAANAGKEVVICNKYPMQTPESPETSDVNVDFNFPSSFGWVNFEQGRDRPINMNRPWSEDFPVTDKAWSYTGSDEAPPSKWLVRRLIDNTSRGGAILVSLCPRADGTIPQSQQDQLIGAGKWLKINGEAIFATRKWDYASDESDAETAQYVRKYKKDRDEKRWFYEDMPEGSIRYTRNKANDAVYVITMGLPTGDKLIAKRLGNNNPKVAGKIKGVKLFGCDEEITWTQTDLGLELQLPATFPNSDGLAFKVHF